MLFENGFYSILFPFMFYIYIFHTGTRITETTFNEGQFVIDGSRLCFRWNNGRPQACGAISESGKTLIFIV